MATAIQILYERLLAQRAATAYRPVVRPPTTLAPKPPSFFPTTTTPVLRRTVAPTAPTAPTATACGSGCNRSAPVPAVEVGTLPVPTAAPASEQRAARNSLASFSFDAPAGFQAPSTALSTGGAAMPDFSKIDWPNDWWKFALGAIAYRVLLAK